MPHTLALRQIYYWLFLAVTLSAAAGGFANQWTSYSILKRFLTERREALQEGVHWDDDIVLRPLEPWSGGNYSWRHHKDGVSERSASLLFLVVLAVALPVVSAFSLSWFTPTVGLGDRGILELSFAGLWVFNWALTYVASRCTFLSERSLFRIMWWNLFWSLASLVVLFAAFQGEFFSLPPSMLSRSMIGSSFFRIFLHFIRPRGHDFPFQISNSRYYVAFLLLSLIRLLFPLIIYR
jgi:hypothetical protein